MADPKTAQTATDPLPGIRPIPAEFLTADERESVNAAFGLLIAAYRRSIGELRDLGLPDLVAEARRGHEAAIKLADAFSQATKIILVRDPQEGGAE